MHVIYTHVRGGAEALKDLVGWLVGRFGGMASGRDPGECWSGSGGPRPKAV